MATPRQFEFLKRTIEKLLKKDKYLLFGEPVKFSATFLPDYLDVIKKPMDLGTVLKKLQNREYKSVQEVVEDCKLTFANAVTYNGTDGESGFVGMEAMRLQETFEEALTKLPGADEEGNDFADLDSDKATKKKPVKKPVDDEESKRKKPRKDSLRAFTFEEKGQLGARIGHLPSDRLPPIVEIIQSGMSASKLKEGKEEKALDVDLNDLDNETLSRIKEYVDSISADAITHTSDELEGLDPTPLQWKEKTALCTAINNLPEDHLLQVFHIIKQNAPRLLDNPAATGVGNEQYVDIDLNKLDTITLRKVQRYVNNTQTYGLDAK